MTQPAIDISALEQQLVNTPRGKNEMIASGVVPYLAAQILKAQFGEDLAFPRKSGAVQIGGLENPDANAEYNRVTGNIHMSPSRARADQDMYMTRNPSGGFIGTDTGPTTLDVLNYLQSLRHELIHARMPDNQQLGQEFLELTKQQTKEGENWRVNANKTDVMLDASQLPSMGRGMNLEEFLATAVPLTSAEQKIGLTSSLDGMTQQQEDMAAIFRLTTRSPVLKELLNRWTRPELRSGKR